MDQDKAIFWLSVKMLLALVCVVAVVCTAAVLLIIHLPSVALAIGSGGSAVAVAKWI